MGRKDQLILDPISALLVVGIVVTYYVLRLSGKRKSKATRIAEMEDADFPIDDADDRGPGAPAGGGRRG